MKIATEQGQRLAAKILKSTLYIAAEGEISWRDFEPRLREELVRAHLASDGMRINRYDDRTRTKFVISWPPAVYYIERGTETFPGIQIGMDVDTHVMQFGIPRRQRRPPPAPSWSPSMANVDFARRMSLKRSLQKC